MTTSQTVTDFIPKEYFVEDLKENRLGVVKIAILRKVVNPLIVRSTDSEATITLQTQDGRELVEIPARKLKSREKLLGLMICREFKTVDESVRYNSIEDKKYLNNPNSILFGDSVTKTGDSIGLTGKVIYDWAYSIRDVKDLTEKLQHNALSEEGNMWDDKEGKQRQSLYLTEYVLPDTYFPHFITVDNITPELFVHLLSTIIFQGRYGAQTTTNANNVENHIISIGFSQFEKPLNSFVISKNWYLEKPNDIPAFDTLQSFMQEQMAANYGNDHLVTNPSELVDLVKAWWNETEKATLKGLYEAMASSCNQYVKSIKLVK